MAESHDPGWKPSYATTAITEWYGIEDKGRLLAQTAEGFRASGHPAYVDQQPRLTGSPTGHGKAKNSRDFWRWAMA